MAMSDCFILIIHSKWVINQKLFESVGELLIHETNHLSYKYNSVIKIWRTRNWLAVKEKKKNYESLRDLNLRN